MTIISVTAGLPASLSSLVGTSVAIRERLSVLTQQSASGKISDTYAGLGAGASISLSIEPLVANHQTWQNNIDAASGPMQAAQTALTQISAVASDFYARTNNLNGLNPSEVDSTAAAARSALQHVAGLLDTNDGNVYVFAGQDSGNPPVPNSDGILTSGFYTQIQTAVGNLAAGGANAVTASTLATAASNSAGTSPFSPFLSQPPGSLASLRSSVSVGQHSNVSTVMLASANADVASSGSSTTGSYVRDILRALATLGSLDSSQVGAPGFAALVADTQTSLRSAITALNGDAGAMGDRQKQLQSTKTGLVQVSTVLLSQSSDAENVDMTATLSRLSQTQTQLQASYQLIAGQQAMSLVKYL